jgi:dCMP deaminase
VTPNKRPDWDTYFMRLAYLAATRATCPRKHVGSIIVSHDHRTVGTGYNGAPAGVDSCDEVGCQMVENHCVRTLHAESNALDYAGRFAQGCTLYCTVTPCWDCAKRIVNAGVNRVVYDEHYESRYGKSMDVPDFLNESGIEVVRFAPERMKRFKILLDLLDKTVDMPVDVPLEHAHTVPPEACAVHRFINDVCVMCGTRDD